MGIPGWQAPVSEYKTGIHYVGLAVPAGVGPSRGPGTWCRQRGRYAWTPLGTEQNCDGCGDTCPPPRVCSPDWARPGHHKCDCPYGQRCGNDCMPSGYHCCQFYGIDGYCPNDMTCCGSGPNPCIPAGAECCRDSLFIESCPSGWKCCGDTCCPPGEQCCGSTCIPSRHCCIAGYLGADTWFGCNEGRKCCSDGNHAMCILEGQQCCTDGRGEYPLYAGPVEGCECCGGACHLESLGFKCCDPTKQKVCQPGRQCKWSDGVRKCCGKNPITGVYDTNCS
jgi:hypothetical protein